jgi:hypothetical protein
MKICLNCNRSENETPLINLTFHGKTWFICPQCLPALIHKPHTLAGKLEGVESIEPADEPS